MGSEPAEVSVMQLGGEEKFAPKSFDYQPGSIDLHRLHPQPHTPRRRVGRPTKSQEIKTKQAVQYGFVSRAETRLAFARLMAVSTRREQLQEIADTEIESNWDQVVDK